MKRAVRMSRVRSPLDGLASRHQTIRFCRLRNIVAQRNRSWAKKAVRSAIIITII